MQQASFREEIRRGSKFLVVAELTGGPGFSLRPMEAFLEAYRKAGEGGAQIMGDGIEQGCLQLFRLAKHMQAVSLLRQQGALHG